MLALFACLLTLSVAQAPAMTAAAHTDPLPAGLSPAIASALASAGVRATVGATTLTFWWVKGVPLKSGGSTAAWTDVEEGTLVGAVNVPQDFRDIRGRVIKAGTYTLRYGIQPANGDHLGVSPFRDFLLLSPAADDDKAEPLGHDGTIAISKHTIGGSHPAVWSIDPPAADDPPLHTHTTDLGHTSIVVEVPATRAGAPAGTLRFGIVLMGKIEA